MPTSIYTPENVQRARYALIGLTVVTVVVCGYLAIGAFMGMRELWTAEKLLRKGKTDAAALSRQESLERRQEDLRPPASDGGVDAFAVKISAWARQRNLNIDSFVPEGAPSVSEIKSGDSKIGSWASSRVRVEGAGEFADLIGFLDELRDPALPVQVQAFELQSVTSGDRQRVGFSLMLTVYEKKGGTS